MAKVSRGARRHLRLRCAALSIPLALALFPEAVWSQTPAAPSRQTDATAVAGPKASALAAALATPAMAELIDYVKSQRTTGFLILEHGRIILERNWPLAPGSEAFAGNFVHGTTVDGALIEDVASQQKSFVAVLAGVAIDKGLLDIAQPVSAYLGQGWSKASPQQEAAITVRNLLEMNSGLKIDFTYDAPAGSKFLYNTQVYATLKPVLAAAAHLSLDELTRLWLTEPAGMKETSWAQRTAAFAAAGNPTGLATSPRDAAKFGAIVLSRGMAATGRRIVSDAQLKSLLQPSATNPSYGRLWWLNGGARTISPSGVERDGPLIPSAPADLVAALGAEDRKIYVVPSLDLVVVRMGQQCPDRAFDENLWARLKKLLPKSAG